MSHRRWIFPFTLACLFGCDGGTSAGAGGEMAEAHPGETVYNRFCFSCHASGTAGAPRTGDAEAWAPRVAKGPDALLASVKNGIAPGMPAMGLCSACTDEELRAATDYMVSRSR